MESLLQPVLESYSKLSIEKQTKPSYVEIYQKSGSDVVLVYSKLKQAFARQSVDKSRQKPVEDELELTGSPLKLDLSLHTVLDETYISEEPQMWKREEATHAPVESDTARDILNLYSQSLWKAAKDESFPMWVLCKPCGDSTLLIHTESNTEQFARGIVVYEGTTVLDEFDVENAIRQFANEGETKEDMVTATVDCRLPISGVSYEGCSVDEQLNAPFGGLTELYCEWTSKSLLMPYISCKVHFVQEVIVGHLASPCNAIWKSVSSLYTINQLLVDMTAAGFNSVNLETSIIRNITPGTKRVDTAKRLERLLNEAETYTYTAECPSGGCLCVTEDTSSLKHCLSAMQADGSSNDFTYKLWDILRECETAEELMTLFIQALKFVSSGKIRPFIDVNNKTYLSKLILKLSRGHSQTAKVLKNLRASPPQALSLVAQVGVEKTMWEYTRVMSLLEHSYFIAGIWNADIRSHESIDQINQTIQDMTMGGDFSLNPFESLTSAEHSIRLDSESFCVEDTNELTVDDFASLKKHGLVSDKKDSNEVPLIADEIDISQWKHLLSKFAQIHVCVEHLYRAEACIRADFAQLKPIATRLLEYYVSDKSPVKTVGQLVSDPVQKINIPIANNIVQDQLKKPALWYRMELTNKKSNEDSSRECKRVYVFSQQPVFPPPVWQNIEPTTDDVAEVTTVEELKYHCTKYTYLCNKVKRSIELS
ncbi:uncharacterized protein LOC121725791 [Aricia agestis]|uniref:uncharacterized protein LOC121725791 n=1 Tax=Aricia agestis TaxID=91739 RepID=UPI001C20A02B|nr:uncharacterized protein LOC121725791 [Aricia agestis]